MSDMRIVQEFAPVKVDAPTECVYRASVTGKLCRATIVKDNGGDYLWVKGDDFGGDKRLIGKDDVISYVLSPQVDSASAPETAIEAGPRDFAPESPVIMPAMESDPRFSYNVERARLNELYQEWMSERDYHGLVLATWHSDTPDQRDRLARYEARYRAQLAVVAAAKSKLTRAHLEWMQEEYSRLHRADFQRFNAHNEQLIAEAV